MSWVRTDASLNSDFGYKETNDHSFHVFSYKMIKIRYQKSHFARIGRFLIDNNAENRVYLASIFQPFSQVPPVLFLSYLVWIKTILDFDIIQMLLVFILRLIYRYAG